MSTIEFTEAELSTAVAARSDVGVRPLDLETLVHGIARRHGTSWDEMKSPTRIASVVAARMALYRVLREHGWSYPSIGRLLNRDHTTVMSAIKGRPRKARTEEQRLRAKLRWATRGAA